MLAQPSGVLLVSLLVDFATIYLTPLVAEFARRYHGISFEFDLTPRRVDLGLRHRRDAPAAGEDAALHRIPAGALGSGMTTL